MAFKEDDEQDGPRDEVADDEASRMAEEVAKPKRVSRARRRWPLRLAVAFVLLALLGWFTPSFVALTPLRHQIVPWAVPDFPAKVQIGSASLGWLSPVRLANVAITDSEGRPLAEAESIVIEKSLLALAANYHQLGTIRLDRPHVHLAVRPDGSNLEDAINPLLAGESTGAKYACRVEVARGCIDLADADGNTGQLAELNIQVDYDAAADPTLKCQLQGLVQSAAKPGVLAVEATWQPAADATAGVLGSGSALVKTDRVAMETLAPLLARVSQRTSVAGELTCNVRWEWKAGGETQTLEIAACDARDLRIVAPAYLGRDELRCASLEVRGNASLEQGRALADRLALDCDFGSLEASGAFDVKDLASASALAAISRDDCRVKGRLDLARLAAALPATLKIREGTQITSGEVTFNVSSRQEQGRRRIVGSLETSKLAATSAGRRIVWDQPISLALSASNSPAGVVIEQLEGNASFLTLTGHGSLADGTLSASGDLDRLAAELGQFIDVEEYKLAGKLQAGLAWKRGQKDAFSATGNLRVENFSCDLPGALPWREERLTAALAASGVATGSALTRIDTASLKLRSGADELDASLSAPVAEPSFKSIWPVKIHLAGSLPTWLARTQSFAPLSGWAVDGTVDLAAAANASSERIEIEAANLALAKLQAWGHGLYIYEPEVVIETSGTWDQVKGELTSRATTLAGTALALRADNVVVQSGASGFSLSGDVDYRGDVARLYSWTYDPRKPQSQHLFGGVTGKLKLHREGSISRASVTTNFDELVIARKKPNAAANDPDPWEALWTEKKATLEGSGEYNHARDGLSLSKLDVASRMLTLAMQGQIDSLSSNRRIEVQGDVGYDLPGIAAFLRPYVGEDFQLAGHDTRKFNLRGPLPDSLFASSAAQAEKGTPATPASTRPAQKTVPFPPDLTGAAGVGWTSAQVQGLALGQGELSAKLNDGIVAFDPLDLPLAEGKLRLSPSILLKSDPMLLVVEKGRILEQVRISPEMCKTWLKYVAPLLADATRAEGRFTLDLASCSLPLFDPETGRVQGALTVHEAQVGPGPLGQQALWIAQQVKALVEKRPLGALGGAAGGAAGTDLLKMPAQKVDFQLVDGRVYHENLTFLVRDVTIRTKGSVGIDQSLALVAEVPVLDRWVEGDRMLARLKGQTLNIPIGGTLSQPKLDGRALEEVSKQMLSGAAKGVIENELNRSLQKLFGPKK